MQRNMNRSIPAGEAMDIAKQVLLAILMLILLSVLIPARAEEAVSPMIVSETADSRNIRRWKQRRTFPSSPRRAKAT